MLNILTPAERRDLKARAHALHPVVMIGNDGLTPAVLKAIDEALSAHELIKIRAVGGRPRRARRPARRDLPRTPARRPVQHIGKILVVWRKRPPEDEPSKASKPKARPRAKARPAAKPLRADRAPREEVPRTPGALGPARPGRAPRMMPKPAALLVADVEDLVCADAARRLHLDHVARVLADQRARDRRTDRDLALLDVGLVVADDLVGDLVARRRAPARSTVAPNTQRPSASSSLRIDDLRVAELALELGDAALDEALALLGGVVLGVLGQIAVRARLGDRGITLGRSTVFRRCSSARSSSAPTMVRGNLFMGAAQKRPPAADGRGFVYDDS